MLIGQAGRGTRVAWLKCRFRRRRLLLRLARGNDGARLNCGLFGGGIGCGFVEDNVVHEVLGFEEDVKLLFVELAFVGESFYVFGGGLPVLEDLAVLLLKHPVALFELVVFICDCFVCLSH